MKLGQNFTLDQEKHGFLFRFPSHCSLEDFYDATIALNEHPNFERGNYCIFDMSQVTHLVKGNLDAPMILAHMLGSMTTNPRLKVAVVSTNDDVQTFASWLAENSDRAAGYFKMMPIARAWVEMSPWIKPALD